MSPTNSVINLENSDDEVQQLSKHVPPTTNSASPYGRSKPPPLNNTIANIYNIVPKKVEDNESIGLAGFILVCTGEGIEYQFPQAVYQRSEEVLNHCHVVRNVFNFKINGIKQEGNKCWKTLQPFVEVIAPTDKQRFYGYTRNLLELFTQ